jgi:SAM-dependent methyltransferase
VATVIYDEEFFAVHRDHTRASAHVILPEVIRAASAKSVVDVGCGVGIWLSAARACGIDDILGLDGPWILPDTLEIPADRFEVADLRQPFGVARTFDLAICMETGEHLPTDRSAGLVADLTSLAPVVLFSAAAPGQGGTRHVNEQWSDFWADLFAARGYECVDAIRWRYWSDERVDYWYAQNGFLYVSKERAPLDMDAPNGLPHRIVHPGNLARRLDPRHVPLRLAVAALGWRVYGGVRRVTGTRRKAV